MSISILKSISDTGAPPATRLESAADVVALVNNLIRDDRPRDKNRAIVKGLFDGNPPWNDAALRRSGQAYRSNVNWRISEATLTTALTAYWDVATEGPSMATVRCELEDDPRAEDYGQTITEEFHAMNLKDADLSYMLQTCHYYMVLYGVGPVIWDDEFDFKARAIDNIMLPTNTHSNVNDWTVAAITMDYPVERLYSFIRNPKAAEKLGWNLEATRKSMMDAFPRDKWPSQSQGSWTWYQQRIRNNDLGVSDMSDAIHVAHVYFREFPDDENPEGAITHCIVQMNGNDFLYRKDKRFDNWRQVICPFYYDVGDGTHHSVKGLGIKAYGALDSYNRLQCNLVTSADFGAAIHIQAESENVALQEAVAEKGPFKIWRRGFNVLPNVQTGQNLQGAMAVKQDLLSTVTSNLSQYRQGLREKGGNPITAEETRWRAENESTLARTQLTRYFDQLDEFWQERYRRAANPNVTGRNASEKLAMAFQDRCKKRGIPAKALQSVTVRATRTVGYGSAYNRLAALNRMLTRWALYPETGKQRILEDLTSADVGPLMMRRYVPEDPDTITGDHVLAQLQVGAAKQGITPLHPPHTHSHETFASVFMQAASQALGSLEQGANPMEVLTFLEAIGPAIAQHLEHLGQDKASKGAYDALNEQFKQLAAAADKLRTVIQKQQQQQAEQARATQGMMNEEQRANAKLQADIGRKERKLQVDLGAKAAKTRQQLAIADVKTSQQLKNEAAKTESEETG